MARFILDVQSIDDFISREELKAVYSIIETDVHISGQVASIRCIDESNSNQFYSPDKDYTYLDNILSEKQIEKDREIWIDLHEDGTNFELGFDTINDERLDRKIFSEELHEFSIAHRETEIENLCMWISECQDSKDKELMLSDLKMLLNWDDEYILSSNETNTYLNKSSKNYNEVCQELLEINNSLKESESKTTDLDPYDAVEKDFDPYGYF